MPKTQYKEIRLRGESLALIEKVNDIVSTYQAQGYSLTLRQVYYQLVSRNIISNNERSYDNLGALISNGRLAGLIDWNAIEDRTRNLRGRSHWTEPGSIIESAAYSYHIDLWEDQEYYLEVWVEKDALVDIVGKVCDPLDIPYFSCRGYVSQSEMWVAAERIIDKGKPAIILHAGDHDPSGIDMSRDIKDRLETFGVYALDFHRIALNREQVDQYDPPPNPAKLTDSRAGGYISEHGTSCWELDALEPSVLSGVIKENAIQYMDMDTFKRSQRKENEERNYLKRAARSWPKIEKFLEEMEN